MEDSRDNQRMLADVNHRELQENTERILALNDNLEALYDVDLDTGDYEEYIKGSTYSEQVKALFIPKKRFFEDVQTNVELVVFSDDRAGVKKVINPKYLRKVLKKENHFDWVYRLVVNGVPTWTRMRIVYKNAEQKRVIIGVFNAEEEVATKEKDENFRKELINRMVKDDGLFLIDCVNDTRKTIHDHCYKEKEFNDKDRYSVSITKYIDSFVAEPDKEMMRKATSIEGMLRRLEDENEYKIEYRDVSSGIQRFYRMRVARLSDTEVLQSFAEKDSYVTNRMIFEKMEEEFFALLLVDVSAGIVKTIKNESFYPLGTEGAAAPYGEVMTGLAAYLGGDPKAFFNRIANLADIKEELSSEDKHTYSYKSQNLGDSSWVDVTSYVIMREEDGTPSMFTLGFSKTDSLRAERHEIENRLKEDMEMIGGLASGYHALYYFNMRENYFKVYSIDGQRVDELRPIVNEGGNPLDMIVQFGRSGLVHPEDRHLFEMLNVEFVRKELAHKKSFSMRFRRNVDGAFLWTELDIIKYEPVDEEPNAIAVGFAVRDAEIRKEMESQRLLKEALEKAEIASRSKTSFLFNMSHDIRTPMNAIRGFTAMAMKYIDDRDKVMEYLEKIDISGSQLLALINQVLEMSRIESGKVEFAQNPINLNQMCNSMITVLSEQAQAAGLEFTYSIDDLVHPDVLADGPRLDSIALNIAGNALKYTPEGGSIRYEFREIPCKKKGYGTYILRVTDTGIGMSEEFQKQMFEPFSRENSSTVSKIQGTGLGMTIVKSLVDLLGGRISVKSAKGQGTCFEVELTLKIDKEEHFDEDKQPSVKVESFIGKKLLLVDDNEMNREIGKNLFEESGFIVDDASDGDVAVEMIRRLVKNGKPDYYDCILMDVQMPRMDGYEATRLIRKLLSTQKKRVPIIAMTANAFEEDRKDAIAAGMDEHLAKPIDVKKCIETLSKFM